MENEKITTLERLAELAKEKRSVSIPARNQRTPAAFILQMSGQLILQLFTVGMYVYEKR